MAQRFVGIKGANIAPPKNDSLGVLPAIASSQPPAYAAGNLVPLSLDNSGNVRVTPNNVPKVIQKNFAVSTGSVASLLADLASTVPGNSIVVVCAVGNNTQPTITDIQGNVYQVAGDKAVNGTAFGIYIFLASGIAGGANSVTVNNGGATASIAMEIYEVQGLLVPSSPYNAITKQTSVATPVSDTTNLATGTGTGFSYTLAPTSPNCLAFAAVAVGTAAQTITSTNAGWTSDSGQLNTVTPSGLFSFACFSRYHGSIVFDNVLPSFSASLGGSEPFASTGVVLIPYVQAVAGSFNLNQIGGSPVASNGAGALSVQTLDSSVIALIDQFAVPLDAGLNTGVAPENGLWITAAPSNQKAAALTPKYINSTAQAVLKASAGNLYGLFLLNLQTVTSMTGILYIHFFNTTTTTSLSTTSWLFAIPIPAPSSASTSAVLSLPPGALALANFSVGITIVVNTTSTSATVASGTGVEGTLFFE